MGTKDKILQCALELFNEKGMREVSTRMISETMGISQGNLTYHFAKKDGIIHELYLQLVAEMDGLFNQAASIQKIGVEEMFQGTLPSYQILAKYRFCMIDFVQLMRDHPKINAHFKQLMIVRKEQFKQIFHAYIQNNILLPEEFPGQYAFLERPLGVFGDYWLSHAEVLFEGSLQEACISYAKSSMMLFYPFLTSPAKEKLLTIIR